VRDEKKHLEVVAAIKALAESLGLLVLGDTSKMSRSEYLSIQLSVRHGESRQQQLQKKLDLLQDSADRDGVPDEFRQ